MWTRLGASPGGPTTGASPTRDHRGGEAIVAPTLTDFLALVSGRRGHFLLESGHHGGLWLDLDALFARPAAIGPFVDHLAARLRAHAPDVVCGPLLLVLGDAATAYFSERRLGLEGVVRDDYLLWAPGDCPLCREGIPLEDVISTAE